MSKLLLFLPISSVSLPTPLWLSPHFHPPLSPTALVGSAGLGLGSGLGTVPGGQPSTPSLNTPGQIDPSSIERAYAALGLTYQGNQVPPQPNQTTSRSLNAIGKHSQRAQGQHKGWASTLGRNDADSAPHTLEKV